MAEDLSVIQADKATQYEHLIPQIQGLIDGESNLIANLANMTAALKEQFNWLWIGFYLIEDDQLVLGPFQGPIACTRIDKGRGVCGTAWAQESVIIVDNVDEFPGHIACSSSSRSEIVLPIYKGNQCIGVLDVDSAELNTFDDIDKKYLSQIIALI